MIHEIAVVQPTWWFLRPAHGPSSPDLTTMHAAFLTLFDCGGGNSKVDCGKHNLWTYIAKYTFYVVVLIYVDRKSVV